MVFWEQLTPFGVFVAKEFIIVFEVGSSNSILVSYFCVIFGVIYLAIAKYEFAVDKTFAVSVIMTSLGCSSSSIVIDKQVVTKYFNWDA